MGNRWNFHWSESKMINVCIRSYKSQDYSGFIWSFQKRRGYFFQTMNNRIYKLQSWIYKNQCPTRSTPIISKYCKLSLKIHRRKCRVYCTYCSPWRFVNKYGKISSKRHRSWRKTGPVLNRKLRSKPMWESFIRKCTIK